MIKDIELKLLPSEAAQSETVKTLLAASLGMPPNAITGFFTQRSSIDARGKQTWIRQSVRVFINEPFQERPRQQFHWQDVSHAKEDVIIVGAGPAGLYAALTLIEHGIRPIVLERGKDVRSRRRDLAQLNKEGVVNPESNYCFGEGGAGTYSDGKLYTRSSKRGDIHRILNIFHHFGADERILYEAHPHIGTNKLPHIITAMREQIRACGGQFLFEQKVTGFLLNNQTIKGVKSAAGDVFEGAAVILATGHSARDIFELLHQENILIEAKPFALGVRIEHPQHWIDQVQYHCSDRGAWLPPASYSLVQQVEGRGVFSFCMCPGGIIAPAATKPGELVVNGWSPSKRNNPYANSGMVVNIEEKDVHHLVQQYGPLAAMAFQRQVEVQAFKAGGGHLVAPALRMTDFCEKKISNNLPDCSYLPGLKATAMSDVLPGFVYRALSQGFQAFGKKMKGFYTRDAVVVATESRTSSPVRIPRNPETLQHPQIAGLYPCGEGAGYAGGIVSAAMDGENCAAAIIKAVRN